MGLSAEELNAETLFPGDTIEYFSMAFVAGDPRGHRVAKVLKVLKDEREYPLRLESQEMLPITLMIRRKLDRHDDEIDPANAKWRKIRTFKLVTGEVKGRTRADRLNQGLKQSMVSAIQAAKAAFGSQKQSGSSREPSRAAAESDAESASERSREKEEKMEKQKQKPKSDSKSERFRQQQLSFFKPAGAVVKGKERHEGREDKKEKEEAKRFSLDFMSRREPSRKEDASALKHKKPRLLPSPPQSSSSQPARAALRYRSSSPPKLARQCQEKSRLAAAPSASVRESKYFGASSSSSEAYHHQQKSIGSKPKKIPLRQFVDAIEEKKSSLKTTLNEYLALDEEKKSLIQKRQRPASGNTASTSSNNTEKARSTSSHSSSKWDRDREDFRTKTQAKSKWRSDSQNIGKWLQSAKSQERYQEQHAGSERQESRGDRRAASSPPADRRTQESRHSRQDDRPRVKVGGLSRGSSRQRSPVRDSLSFVTTPPTKMKTPEKQHKRQQYRDSGGEDDADNRDVRKRKRSGDFASPGKRPSSARKGRGLP